jgi:hypothetical protein
MKSCRHGELSAIIQTIQCPCHHHEWVEEEIGTCIGYPDWRRSKGVLMPPAARITRGQTLCRLLPS